MDIADWRQKIDELDRQIVKLISERASAAQAIGRLKRATDLPIYEPTREMTIFENVRKNNPGPAAGYGADSYLRAHHRCNADLAKG